MPLRPVVERHGLAGRLVRLEAAEPDEPRSGGFRPSRLPRRVPRGGQHRDGEPPLAQRRPHLQHCRSGVLRHNQGTPVGEKADPCARNTVEPDAASLSPRSPAAASLAGATVLQIIPSLDAGGAERTTIDIAGALAEAGGRALVASRGGRLVSELQARGGIWIPFPADAKNPAAMAWNVARLARLIRLERPAIVHARSRAPAWVALGATRLTGTPFMTTFHGAYGGTSALKLRYNSVMARGDVVIANSRLHARPHRVALSLGGAADRGRASRHRPQGLLAGRRGAGPGRQAPRRLGRRGRRPRSCCSRPG